MHWIATVSVQPICAASDAPVTNMKHLPDWRLCEDRHFSVSGPSCNKSATPGFNMWSKWLCSLWFVRCRLWKKVRIHCCSTFGCRLHWDSAKKCFFFKFCNRQWRYENKNGINCWGGGCEDGDIVMKWTISLKFWPTKVKCHSVFSCVFCAFYRTELYLCQNCDKSLTLMPGGLQSDIYIKDYSKNELFRLTN